METSSWIFWTPESVSACCNQTLWNGSLVHEPKLFGLFLLIFFPHYCDFGFYYLQKKEYLSSMTPLREFIHTCLTTAGFLEGAWSVVGSQEVLKNKMNTYKEQRAELHPLCTCSWVLSSSSQYTFTGHSHVPNISPFYSLPCRDFLPLTNQTSQYLWILLIE